MPDELPVPDPVVPSVPTPETGEAGAAPTAAPGTDAPGNGEGTPRQTIPVYGAPVRAAPTARAPLHAPVAVTTNFGGGAFNVTHQVLDVAPPEPLQITKRVFNHWRARLAIALWADGRVRVGFGPVHRELIDGTLACRYERKRVSLVSASTERLALVCLEVQVPEWSPLEPGPEVFARLEDDAWLEAMPEARERMERAARWLPAALPQIAFTIDNVPFPTAVAGRGIRLTCPRTGSGENAVLVHSYLLDGGQVALEKRLEPTPPHEEPHPFPAEIEHVVEIGFPPSSNFEVSAYVPTDLTEEVPPGATSVDLDPEEDRADGRPGRPLWIFEARVLMACVRETSLGVFTQDRAVPAAQWRPPGLPVPARAPMPAPPTLQGIGAVPVQPAPPAPPAPPLQPATLPAAPLN